MGLKDILKGKETLTETVQGEALTVSVNLKPPADDGPAIVIYFCGPCGKVLGMEGKGPVPVACCGPEVHPVRRADARYVKLNASGHVIGAREMASVPMTVKG